MGQRISAAVKDQYHGGGKFWKGGIATIIDIETGIFPFGKFGDKAALQVTLELDKPFEVDGKETTEYTHRWAAGGTNLLVPDDDRVGFQAAEGSNATGINDGVALGQLCASLVNAGFDDNLLAEGDYSVLKGLRVEFKEMESKFQGGEKKKEGADAGQKNTVLLVTRLVGKADTKKKTSSKRDDDDDDDVKPAKKTAAETKKKPADDDDDDAKGAPGGEAGEALSRAIRKVLKAAGKPLKKVDVVQDVHDMLEEQKSEHRKEALQLLGDGKMVAKIASFYETWEFDAEKKTFVLSE